MKQLTLTPELYDYLLDISLREHAVLKALREATQAHPLALMQIAPEQAQFLQFLIKTIHAKQVLELGTFTGYSALAMALALPDDGQVYTCDIKMTPPIDAPYFWKQAEQDHKILQHIEPALTFLDTLLSKGFQGHFDFIFIDADKTNYLAYYERSLSLLSPKGIIAIDNVLWGGRVIDETDNRAQTREIKRLNAFIKNDERVDVSFLGIADGLLLVRHATTNETPHK